jgi:hypothetical protein
MRWRAGWIPERLPAALDVRGAEEPAEHNVETESLPTVKRSYAEQAKGTEIHIQKFRAMLMFALPHLGAD